MLLFMCYGINCGAVYAIATVMNQIIVQVFPEHGSSAGLLGFLATSRYKFCLQIFASNSIPPDSALFSATILGYIIDKTRKFKIVTVVCYAFCILSLVGFAGLLRLQILWPMYPMAFVVGFFMTGYMSLGFEFGAELTYPEPEG